MSKLLLSLAVMCELTDTNWSEPTVKAIEQELSAYPEADVLGAIRKCQGELARRVTLADILDRIPSQHPGVEEAWVLVSQTMNNEHISIVWTDQMRKAFGAAVAVQDDKIAARMAFKEVYSRELREARANHVFPVWNVSLGYDPIMREECVKQAAQKNLIGQAYAAKLIAYDPPTEEAVKLLEKL
ncbi:MAG: hypothetical protein OEW25_01025 [Nitrospira sp.]|nr:hypothetical protein [Nitrospira sp.]MDH5251880.1 hypothetical protein [Nitrospira sp.]